MFWSTQYLLSLPQFDARTDQPDRRVKIILISNYVQGLRGKTNRTNLGVRWCANSVWACAWVEFRDYIIQHFPPVVVWIQSIVRQFKYLRHALTNQNWPMHYEIKNRLNSRSAYVPFRIVCLPLLLSKVTKIKTIHISAVLHRDDTWSLTLKKKNMLGCSSTQR
jgi:hypothetical protein